MIPLPDQIRDVPEFAVRLFLGADCLDNGETFVVKLDDEKFTVPKDTFEKSARIAKALSVRPRRVETAGDILKLRHDAEELFLGDLVKANGLVKILFSPAGEIASSYYRAMIPASVMTDAGTALAHHTHRLDLAKALKYDILWIQLSVSPMLLGIAEEAKKAGVKIVYDIDDRFESIPESNPASNFYKGKKVDQIWKIIEMADLVTVSTEPLAEFIRPRARKVSVLPNMPAAGLWPSHASINPREFRILWAGSPTHGHDLAIVAPSLQKLLKKYDGKVRFICFGEQVPEPLMEVRQFVDLIEFVEFEHYAQKLLNVGANVAIAPLEKNDFNDCKSAIKYFEYSICQYPSLLSPVGEYEKIVEKNGAPAVLVEDDCWDEALEDCLGKFNEHLEKLGKSAYQWVKDNRCIIKAQAKPWLDAAQELVA